MCQNFQPALPDGLPCKFQTCPDILQIIQTNKIWISFLECLRNFYKTVVSNGIYFSLTVLKARKPNEDVNRATLSPEALKGICSYFLPLSGDFDCSLAYGHIIQYLPPSSHCLLCFFVFTPMYGFQNSFCFSIIRIYFTEYRIHGDNSG